jgi:hypothetical protein
MRGLQTQHLNAQFGSHIPLNYGKCTPPIRHKSHFVKLQSMLMDYWLGVEEWYLRRVALAISMLKTM